ncbi:hypothetical protein [Synechococcus sp. WH 8016]|uniref:hypothetical protein n=1 Tax=Synechococcus sp. WH 8016 TaxID=166318 RepID=UPI0002FE944F|nr:hypothetical protein [Synechococcus sp. WH 8016]
MATANTATTLSNTAVSTEKPLPKNYAGFNSLTLEGRIFNAELVTRDGQEFLSVSVIQNLQDDDMGCEFCFTNSNGLMSLYKKGYLPAGRRCHVVGHVKEVTSTWTDKATGEVKLLKRPRVRMDQVTVTVGAMPAAKN